MTSISITSRSFEGASDLRAMAELVRAFPNDHAHVVDLPYRLASPSLEFAENVRIWTDANNALVAFGVVQQPWQALDYAVHPCAYTTSVEDEILTWATERAAGLAAERGSSYLLNIYVPEASRERMAALERHGFRRDDSWSMVYLRQSPIALPARAPIPEGFVVRPLAGMKEVDAYVALHRTAFGSTNMTVPWRQRTLEMPEHIHDLDLVIAAADGQLAAFCICWLHPNRRAAQIEPLGVHPDFQQLGLGRAILVEALERARAHGAEAAIVESYADNDPARHLYESVGFRPSQTLITYGLEAQ